MPLDARVTDYTSYADTATIPGHYVLFWELTINASSLIPPPVLEGCYLTIEESLNSIYRQGRTSDKSIGPLEIRIVETALIELLNSRVVSSYFSPMCPKWVPGSKQWNNAN